MRVEVERNMEALGLEGFMGWKSKLYSDNHSQGGTDTSRYVVY
ncbi:hypothetical protein [Membranihabitans marinus]|nr:hypothetical protein [Membranihabitans marinus]